MSFHWIKNSKGIHFCFFFLFLTFQSVPNEAVELIQKNSSLWKKEEEILFGGRKECALKVCVFAHACVWVSECVCDHIGAAHLKSLTLLPGLWIDGVTIKEEIWNSKREWFDWLLSRLWRHAGEYSYRAGRRRWCGGSPMPMPMTTIIQFWDSLASGRFVFALHEKITCVKQSKKITDSSSRCSL